MRLLHDIAALLPEEAKAYEGACGTQGAGSVTAGGGEGIASDLQHSCALPYQVSQGELLKL